LAELCLQIYEGLLGPLRSALAWSDLGANINHSVRSLLSVLLLVCLGQQFDYTLLSFVLIDKVIIAEARCVAQFVLREEIIGVLRRLHFLVRFSIFVEGDRTQFDD
jgi:hypothetical protein